MRARLLPGVICHIGRAPRDSGGRSVVDMPTPDLLVTGDLATALPDFGDPNAIGTAAIVGGFLGAAVARLRGYTWEEAERIAFRFGYVATGLSIALYLSLLIADLY
jgi:hypothetical protein